MGTDLKQAAQAFAKVHDGIFENWSLWRTYFRHYSASIRNIRADSVDTAAIYFHMSWYLRLGDRHHATEDLARKSTQVQADFPGHEPPPTLASMDNLASTYWNQGRW